MKESSKLSFGVASRLVGRFPQQPSPEAHQHCLRGLLQTLPSVFQLAPRELLALLHSFNSRALFPVTFSELRQICIRSGIALEPEPC